MRQDLFISPIFPELSDWKSLVRKTKGFVDEYWFENLNFYPSIRGNIFKFLRENKPELVERYMKLDDNYWNGIKKEIRKFCKGLKYNVYFHHKEIKQNV